MGSRILILCICNGLAPSVDWPERGEGESRKGVVEGEGACLMVIGYVSGAALTRLGIFS